MEPYGRMNPSLSQISSDLLISRLAAHFGSAETNLPKVHFPITLPYLDITSLLRYPPCRPLASPSRKEGASMWKKALSLSLGSTLDAYDAFKSKGAN